MTYKDFIDSAIIRMEKDYQDKSSRENIFYKLDILYRNAKESVEKPDEIINYMKDKILSSPLVNIDKIMTIFNQDNNSGDIKNRVK